MELVTNTTSQDELDLEARWRNILRYHEEMDELDRRLNHLTRDCMDVLGSSLDPWAPEENLSLEMLQTRFERICQGWKINDSENIECKVECLASSCMHR